MLTVADILANSSDVGAIKIALRLGSPKFYDYIRAFGFGTPTGVDLPGESRGVAPPPESLGLIFHCFRFHGAGSRRHAHPDDYCGFRDCEWGLALQAARGAGNAARRTGACRWMDPPLPKIRAGLSAQKPRRRCADLMEGVILHGTGKNARLDGWTAAGKTGTAQKIDPNTKRYSPTQVIASFTGFAPINNPAVTILVSLDSPAGYPHDGGTSPRRFSNALPNRFLPISMCRAMCRSTRG